MARTKIMQLDYDSGELIEVYESIKAAAEFIQVAAMCDKYLASASSR